MDKEAKFDFNFISSGDMNVGKIIAAHRYITPPSSYIRYATETKHDRLVYVVSGSASFDMFSDKPVEADAGSLIYIPCNIAYVTEWKQSARAQIYSISFILTDENGYPVTLCPEIYKINGSDITSGLFKECCNAYLREQYGHALKCKELFYKLMYEITVSEKRTNSSKVSKAIHYLNSNYLDDIPIGTLAKMCNLGECMFRRAFKNETGVSPLKYKNNLKINKAYELIRIEGYSVTEAMELTGFYDASYFNKTFKAHIGTSPSKCREKKISAADS